MSPRLQSGKPSRVSRILKWIQQQNNPLVCELHLEVDGDAETSERVAAWVKDKKFDPAEVAAEIDEILVSMSTEQDAKIVGRLVWVTDKGIRWTTFPLKVEPEGGAQSFDGSLRNLLVQQQRHIESIALSYFKATDNVLKTQNASTESLTKAMESITNLIDTRENRSANLENEIARLRDENAQLQAQAYQSEQVAEQAVQSAEAAVDEIAARKESQNTDGKMLQLLTKVAGDIAQGTAKG